MVKNTACSAGDTEDVGSLTGDGWVGKAPWRRAWRPTPVFLSGKSDGQRSLAGYNPWGHKELDTTERLSTHTHTHTMRPDAIILVF